MCTVAETSAFARRADALLAAEVRDDLIYALYIFGKGEKEDLTADEKRAMKQIAGRLKDIAKEKSRRARQ